jgi:TonB-dependent receptor
VRFDTALRDEKEYLKSRVFEIGGQNDIAGNALDYHVGYTQGLYEKPYDLNSTFSNPTVTTATYDNTSLPNWPAVATPGFNPANPAGYLLSGMYNQSQHSKDSEWGIGTNLRIPTSWFNAANESLKVGVNARLRSRVASAENLNPDNLPPLALTDASFGNPVLFYQGHYVNAPQIDPAVLRGVYAASTVTDDVISDAGSYQNDRENVFAVYGQYQLDLGALGLIGGLRVEDTQANYAANLIDSSTAVSTVTPISRHKSYSNFFPTVQARYELTPDSILRGAVSSTIARPGFNQVTAATTIDPSGSVSTGNPELKPITATALDVSFEKYLPHAGIASLGLFDKEIRNYIVTQEANLPLPAQGGFVGLARTFTFANASRARVYGVEANYSQRFVDILPGPLGGLGVSANWTWVQSNYDIRPGESSVLPSTSRNTANAQLSYALHPVEFTLGAYFVSRNIFAVGDASATDIWAQKRLSVDFGSQYQVTPLFSLYFNAKNLTNTALKFTEGAADNRVIQREFYGATVQAGFNFRM